MQLPTTTQIRTAIEVLKKFGEHLSTDGLIKRSDCTNPRTPTKRLPASDLGRLTKPRASRPSPHNWSSGAPNSTSKGSKVFLITYRRGEALPLVATRILRPRMSRGVSAEQPRNAIGSRPRQQPVREHGLTTHRAQTRLVHVREQSAIAFCPRPQRRQGTSLGHERELASAIREQAVASVRTRPPSVHDLGRSMSSTAPPSRTVHDSRLATARARQRIRVSVSPPTRFPVHIHFIPAYGLV